MSSSSPALTVIPLPAAVPCFPVSPLVSPATVAPSKPVPAALLAPAASPIVAHSSAQQVITPNQEVLTHRLREILWHIPWYGFKTQARLAQDSGVSPAAISRLIRGESQPSLLIALRLTQALSRRLGRPLDIGEVFSLDGIYPTPSVCELTGCRRCLPPSAYDQADQIRPEYKAVQAGQWSMPNTPEKALTEVARAKGGL